MKLARLILKEAFFIAFLQFNVVHVSSASELENAPAPSSTDLAEIQVDVTKILEKSQLSYRADGGFSSVESFGVIISCVKGQISVLKSLHDPRLGKENGTLHRIGNMSQEAYVNLWATLQKQAVLKLKDCPTPRRDHLDEFTVNFTASLGNDEHCFRVNAITRPEASRYFAIKRLIDSSVNMSALWNEHQAMLSDEGRQSHAAPTGPFKILFQ